MANRRLCGLIGGAVTCDTVLGSGGQLRAAICAASQKITLWYGWPADTHARRRG